MISAEYRLPLWPKLTHPAARSLGDSWATCFCIETVILIKVGLYSLTVRRKPYPTMNSIMHNVRCLFRLTMSSWHFYNFDGDKVMCMKLTYKVSKPASLIQYDTAVYSVSLYRPCWWRRGPSSWLSTASVECEPQNVELCKTACRSRSRTTGYSRSEEPNMGIPIDFDSRPQTFWHNRAACD